jgi:ADP-heptose:LPS heptosyltransferase
MTNGESLLSVSRKLKPGRFDLALVLPNSPRSALEPCLARIPRRIGYSRPWRNWFLTQAVASRPDAVKMHKRSVHEIQQLINAPSTQTQNSKLKTFPPTSSTSICTSPPRLARNPNRCHRSCSSRPKKSSQSGKNSDWLPPQVRFSASIPARNTVRPNAGRPSVSSRLRGKFSSAQTVRG